MGRFLSILVLGCVTISGLSLANAKPQQSSPVPPVSAAGNTPGDPEALPPTPKGKSTVIGGAIRQVDLVRDQLTLNVYGGKPMKILFDERTLLYLDGVKTPLSDLRPEAHASVETVLDGTDVFARSIHILSRPPQGDFQGQVLSFNSGTGELTVSPVLSREPIVLHVPAGTPIARVGQAAASSATAGLADLVKGTLISVKFQSGVQGKHQGIASQISIVATPGSSFVFSGNITFLDLHAHVLAVVDPRDGQSYRISFDPARFANSGQLHQGSQVKVTADFDGTRYVASAIKIE